ncbi:MAG: phosphoribosylanthranilate isomerase [Cycloclasticus sp.]|nr:phosphoribosylanthranilate isomerase [Cycloclasticus sp.]
MALRARVKICGITQVDDALAAVDNGVDALGFVFYDISPRCIDIANANKIINKLPPFINKVALFVNPDSEDVSRVLNATNIDLLQFHGDEDEAFCSSFNMPYLKAIRMRGTIDLNKTVKAFSSASGLLLDAFDSAQYGGTGQTFDWELVPKQCDLPIILAGGLNENNIYDAIKNTNSYAVDVSSGVEKSKGIKDHLRIKQFMHEVKRANK